MSCDWLIKVSQLIDNELSAADAEMVRAHISNCQECCNSENEYLALRNRINNYTAANNIFAQQRALNNILIAQQQRPWGRKITLPAPMLALLMLVTFIVGIAGIRLIDNSSVNHTGPIIDQTSQPAPTSSPATMASDLSRFDQGQRALIQVIKKSQRQNSGAQQ